MYVQNFIMTEKPLQSNNTLSVSNQYYLSNDGMDLLYGTLLTHVYYLTLTISKFCIFP